MLQVANHRKTTPPKQSSSCKVVDGGRGSLRSSNFPNSRSMHSLGLRVRSFIPLPLLEEGTQKRRGDTRKSTLVELFCLQKIYQDNEAPPRMCLKDRLKKHSKIGKTNRKEQTKIFGLLLSFVPFCVVRYGKRSYCGGSVHGKSCYVLAEILSLNLSSDDNESAESCPNPGLRNGMMLVLHRRRKNNRKKMYNIRRVGHDDKTATAKKYSLEIYNS